MATAIKTLLLLHGLLVCGQAMGAPAATLETLLKTITEDKGRPVYEAFKAIPEIADTTRKQAKAFEALSTYLGQTNNYCVVPNYYSPESHVVSKRFSYAKMASEAIKSLGEPGRRGLVACLTSPAQSVALQAAFTLCEIEESAISTKGRPESKNFPPLAADARTALESFLQQHGDSLPVRALTRFYRAGLPAAAEHIHTILKTTGDPGERHSAVIHLGSYGYAPALNDLLQIFKETSDKNLRLSLRETFRYFIDSERVTKSITEIMENTKDEGLRMECQIALELIKLSVEIRKQYGGK